MLRGLESLCKYYGVTVLAESAAASAPGIREKYHMRKLLGSKDLQGCTRADTLNRVIDYS